MDFGDGQAFVLVVFVVLVAAGLAPAIAGGHVRNLFAKGVCSFVSLVGWAVLARAVFFLPFGGGPNGWLSLVACVAAFAVCMLFVWKPFARRTRRITAASIITMVVALAASVIGPELYQNLMDAAGVLPR